MSWVAIELAREAGAAILEHYEGPLDVERKISWTTLSQSRRRIEMPTS
jgi:hypothetical protein